MATLYRAMNEAERDDLVRTGRMRSGVGSCEGKHFAVFFTDAVAWGDRMSGRPFWVATVVIDDTEFRNWFRFDYKLDGVGPACFADETQLTRCKVTAWTRIT